MNAAPTASHWLTLHGLFTALAVLVYVVTAHLAHQRRQPAAAIAWMLFILLLPYLALPAFLAFGSRKLQRPSRATTVRQGAAQAADAWAVDTLLALAQPAPAAYADLHLHVDGGQARTALFDTLAAAKVSIDLCTFILGRDSLGDAVIDLLCQQAGRGVRVRLLLDGMGSLMAGRPDLRRLTAVGIEALLFVPPLHSPLKGRTNLRDHRKLVLGDAGLASARLWCGGRNLALAYFDGAPGTPPWRDLSFDLRGPLLDQASALFERDWAFAKGLPPAGAAAAAVPASTPLPSPTPPAPSWPTAGAQLVASGPDQADDTVYALLVTAAYRARRRITLATPYFVPDPALLMGLCLAARRGVAVDLLLPARSNHRLSDMARNRALRSLAAAGGRIWLAPGMLHAKLVVVDETLALAGSANLDSRSLFLNYELMVAFHQAGDVRRFEAWFDRERLTARAYTASPPGLLRDIAEGLLLWLGFQL
jgi:cardiolipin synthase